MKILVIGSNSFSGSNLINKLIDLDYQVIGISRSKEKNNIFLPYKKNRRIKNFQFYQMNINHDNKKISNLIKNEKIKNIFNFSAQGEVKSSFDFPIDHFRTNLMSQIDLVEKIKNFDFIDNYLQISTPEIYGTTNKKHEESFNLNPSSAYAASKASFDLYLLTLFKTYKFPVKFIRSSNVFGPCQQLYRIIPKTFILINKNQKLKLYGEGKSKKVYTFIDDISEAEILIMNKGKIGDIYHVASNNLISIKNLVQKIFKITNKNFHNHVEFSSKRIGEDKIYNISSTKVQKELGWKPKTSLIEGLLHTQTWINNNFDYLNKLKLEYIHKK